MARRNPFDQAYGNRMSEAFGDSWGVAGDPMGEWLAGLESDAQAAYRQRKKQHPGMKRDAFFRKSAFSPDRLQEHYDQFGGGTPTGPWDRRPGRGDRPDPVDPGPITGGPADPDEDWQNTNLPAAFSKHLGGMGFRPGDPSQTSAFDDWLHNTQFNQANLDYETWKKDPANATKRFTEYLGQGTWNDPRAIRERFFSQDPSRRFEGSERYTGPGRTIAY